MASIVTVTGREILDSRGTPAVSFLSEEHLNKILDEAVAIVSSAFTAAGV